MICFLILCTLNVDLAAGQDRNYRAPEVSCYVVISGWQDVLAFGEVWCHC